jgi:carboxylate-amine ligase
MTEHAFGASTPFTVGIEEELLVVEPPAYQLAHASEELLVAMALEERSARHDIYEAQIELSSRPSKSVTEAIESLAQLRESLRRAGGTALGAGLHPAAPFGDVRLVDAERYERMARSLRGIVRRTPDCALHVHVGMPDPETAIRVCNGLRAYVPLLEALAANSPFWHGLDSGLASARRALRRSFPRVGIPPHFHDYDHYERAIEEVVSAGELSDYSFVWWEVRPHPRFGTVELRAMDSQSSLASVAGIAALIQGLAAHLAQAPSQPPVSDEAVAESSFRAGRDGMKATFSDGEETGDATQLARAALALARPRARELGSDSALEEVERIVHEGGGADRQRDVHAQSGMQALLEWLVADSQSTDAVWRPGDRERRVQ